MTLHKILIYTVEVNSSTSLNEFDAFCIIVFHYINFLKESPKVDIISNINLSV